MLEYNVCGSMVPIYIVLLYCFVALWRGVVLYNAFRESQNLYVCQQHCWYVCDVYAIDESICYDDCVYTFYDLI